MSDTNARRSIRVGTMHHPAPRSAVFALLCPVREREWLEGWAADIVYSESGAAEPGCVFTTVGPEGVLDVWTISRHDPAAGIVEFVVVATGLYVMLLEVGLEDEGDGTRALWRRTFTALSAAGERAMDAIDHAHHRRRLAHLEASINHFLATGMMLRA